MRNDLGKWLMDIAKYVATAIVITSMFDNITNKWYLLTGGIATVILTLCVGLWLSQNKN